MYYESENYLAHHGIKGQKHGLRRFQNTDGSLTAEGRERYGVGPARKDKAAKEKAKAAREKKKAATIEKRRTEKQKKVEDDHEKTMQYLRKHPRQMYKHRTRLTEDDVNRLKSEIEFDRKLKDIRDSEVKRTWDKISTLNTNMQTISNLLTNSKNAYNNVADIHNMLVDIGKVQGKKMAKIGTDNDKILKENEKKDQ